MRTAARRTPAALVAAVAVGCLAAAVAAAVHVHHLGGAARTTHASRPSGVSMQALSATDVLAVPARAGQTGVEHLVVLGDSVATGAGCDCPPFGPRLARLLAASTHRAVQVSTYARDGYETTDLLAQLGDDVATASALRTASAVVVVIGANDFDESEAADGCGGGVPETHCYDDGLRALPDHLDSALSRIMSLAGPHTKLVVTGYWNVFLDGAVGASKGPTYERTSDALTRRVNDAIRAAAIRAGGTYADLYSAFHVGGNANDTSLLATDGDHPSGAGHQRIAEVLMRYLNAS